MRINPGMLKLELLCRGIRIGEDVNLEGCRRILRTRGGLGSGLEMILPEEVWVNAPVHEGFASNSPYGLIEDGGLYITRDGDRLAKAGIPKNPEFYEKETSDGIKMNRIGITQGGYLAFYLGPRCGYWDSGLNCRFCSSGLNVGKTEIENKTLEQVLEVAEAAFNEGMAEFIHINTGFIPDESRGLKFLEPYVRLLKKETGCLIAVQTNPPRTDDWIERAYSFGTDSISFNFEVYDRKVFGEVCPGKARLVGRERFFSAMEYAAGVFPNGSVAGEIIAGLEPPESTMRGVEHITSVGALPIVCVFRPLEGTPLERRKPPDPERIAPVFAEAYRLCKKNRIRMSLADKVPLVVTPLEGRYFTGERPGLPDFLAQKIYRTRTGKKTFSRLNNIRRTIRYGRL